MKKPPAKPDAVTNDSELFRQEVSDIKPLAQKRRPIPVNKAENADIKLTAQQQNSLIDSHYSEGYEPQTLGNEEFLSFQRSGIQHRLFRQLRNGQLTLDAELDLHGMTISIAHQQLADFIHHCREQRIRCVRIIHGKGWGSKDNKPILKTKLNAWLQQEENVLAFCSALIEDGGTGAVYVLLRRTMKE